jgi:Fur family ferric uptake transcriptional regulator
MAPAANAQHQHAASAAAHEPFTLDGLVQLLRRKGLRMTGNRRAILQALLASRRPMSLEELQRDAGAQARGGDAPDFTTVFRMMNLLEELRLARKVHLGRAVSFYELTDSQHHRDHLVCTDCGQVTPLEGICPVERLERQIARKHGFTQLTHSLEFFGVCGDCGATARN